MSGFVQRVLKNPVWFIFLFGFSIHLWHIGADLPYNYQVDEPHHINKAANFGNGSLNPHDFKYPTLWSYVLAGMLGGLYVAGKFLGLVGSSVDFAQKYLYDQGFFFFFGRVLSCFFLSLVPVVFYRLCRKYYSEQMALTCAFFALLSSSMSDFGLQAVPYSLLVFFASCALVPLHEILMSGKPRDYATMGFFIGLAVSTHYPAAPFASLFIISIFQEKEIKDKMICLAVGVSTVATGFFLGTPFVLLDFKSALPDFVQHYQIEHIGLLSNINHEKISAMSGNILHFMDHFGLGFFLVLIGVYSELKEKRWRVLLWFLPFVSALPILLITFYGAVLRYTVLLSLPLFIPAAQGFLYLFEKVKTSWIGRAALIVIVAGTFSYSYFLSRVYLTLPDVRTQAKTWIEMNVPAGEKIFSPGPYEGPPLLMSKVQVERLYEKTRELKHPREAYFRTLLSGHPGGGYEIFYLKKTIDEVMDLPLRTEKSFQAQEQIDVINEGAAPLIKQKIYTVVISKEWEHMERHQKWLGELRAKYKLVASYDPDGKKLKGYPIKIYRYNNSSKERS